MIFDEYYIKSLVRPIQDWPKPGVTFRDITPVYLSPKAQRMVADSLIQRYVETEITHIGALDARGFLLGSVLAYELNKPLVLFRKQGKLPSDTLQQAYDIEYGQAVLEVHKDAIPAGASVLLLDDLIATGGTLCAAASLVKALQATIYEAAAIIDLPDLGGSQRLQDLGIPTYTLCAF
ncbi:adenine phosphoribosyltransferase [Aestuariirhabdus litorea]|uniref:Adenine phosphoribosyltransferase n=1 Tax=Aestuariirhabdus litorea TaxID=2528527 RepID=A0A3P3VNW8_9GAMM|nr:adenine phosphoribosyltransferase [Aestuariirhabdus litorea]RRJ84452.1 adenine phosphoribosyltransferase [Aestuariirhabdus litorea]RWW97676.1 adenine phosphoribosyltransferase [Endozoicomonadaceae bacterium GTF-13]